MAATADTGTATSTATTTAAASTAASTEKALARTIAPHDYWRGRTRRVDVGQDRWRLYAMRGPDKPRIRIDPICESFDWNDASAILTGSLTLRLPADRLDLTEGHVVACQHSQGGSPFREIWRMRISDPQANAGDGGYTVTLTSDLALLKLSSDDFDYRRNKTHPKGWLASQICADVGRRYGFRVRRFPRCTHRIKKLHKPDTSPYDVLIAAILKEKEATKVKYVMRWERNGIVVERSRRSREMLILGPHLIEAALNLGMRDELATALTVKASVGGKGKKKQKISRRVVSRPAANRYGYIHRKITATDVDSTAEAIRFARRQLAELAKPQRELSVTVPGMVGLRRGAALRVRIPELNPVAEKALRQVIFATEIRHAVSAGDYTMDVTCGFDDPYLDKDEQARQERCEKARRRGRKIPKNCAGARKRATSKKATTRSNK